MMWAPAGPPLGRCTVAVVYPSAVTVAVTLSPVMRVTVRGPPGREAGMLRDAVLTGVVAGATAAIEGVTAVSARRAAPRPITPRRRDVGKDKGTPRFGVLEGFLH
jgi:hypothetical protein